MIKNALLPQKVETKFIYPPGLGGFGSFFDTLFARCKESAMFTYQLNDSLVELSKTSSGALLAKTRSGDAFSGFKLAWSGNLNNLSQLVAQASHVTVTIKPLSYLNTIFFNYIAPENKVNVQRGAQWIYVSDGNLSVSRITCMREFHSETTPSGYYNFIAEVTEAQIHSRAKEEMKLDLLKEKVTKELKYIGFLKNSFDLDESPRINNYVEDTYPIYEIDYKERFNSVHKIVKAFSREISLLGRSGAFWYNNSDHSIRMAIEYVKREAGASPEEFDYRSYFGGDPEN